MFPWQVTSTQRVMGEWFGAMVGRKLRGGHGEKQWGERVLTSWMTAPAGTHTEPLRPSPRIQSTLETTVERRKGATHGGIIHVVSV